MTVSSLLVGAGSTAWDDALGRLRHDVYHLPGYGRVDAGPGEEPVAFVHREGDSVFLLPLVLRPIEDSTLRDARSPYGYPGPVSNVPAGHPDAEAFWHRAGLALTATLREAGVIACFVRLNPLLEVPTEALARTGEVVVHGNTVAVDLTQTPEELWSATRSNHRRQINRARRDGVTTSIDDWSRLPDFIAIYHETMKRVGATDFYFFDDAYFAALRTELPENVHLVVAEHEGEALAGGLFFACDGITQYHLGATRDDALARQPMKLVQSDAMAWARERGDRAFHLGGGLGGTDDPLFHFKAGFSSWHLPFGTWRVVTDPDSYARLCAERSPGVDPSALSSFFPAYRSSV